MSPKILPEGLCNGVPFMGWQITYFYLQGKFLNRATICRLAFDYLSRLIAYHV